MLPIRFLSTLAHRRIVSHVSLHRQLAGRRLSQSTHLRDHVGRGNEKGQDGSHQEHRTNGKPSGNPPRNLAIVAIGVVAGYAGATFYSSDATKASPNAFIKYRLASKDEISSTSAIFTVRPASGAAIKLNDVPKRAIASVEFKQPQLQIARSYTLLPPTADQEENELRFYIRKEARGEVSGYLHRLAVGSYVDFRGPHVDYVLPPDVEEVLFLAGGTGIVPALLVASALSQVARVHVLWANRRREDCVGGRSSTLVRRSTLDTISGWWKTAHPDTSDEHIAGTSVPEGSIVGLLDRLKSAPDNSGSASKKMLSVDYFVDEEGTFIQPRHVQSMVAPSDRSSGGRKVLLISGPEGFVDYWAGPKQWINGREVQGPVGGALGRLNTAGWEIVKL